MTYYIRTQSNLTPQIWTNQTRLIKFELNYIRLIKLNSNRFNLSNLIQLLSQLDISNLMYYIWTRLNYFHNSTTPNRSQLIKLNISNSNLSNLTYQTQFNQIQFIKTRFNYFHNSSTFNYIQSNLIQIMKLNSLNSTYQTQFNQMQFIKLDLITFTTRLHSIVVNSTKFNSSDLNLT